MNSMQLQEASPHSFSALWNESNFLYWAWLHEPPFAHWRGTLAELAGMLAVSQQAI